MLLQRLSLIIWHDLNVLSKNHYHESYYYNYQFLIDAFAATDTTSVQPAPTGVGSRHTTPRERSPLGSAVSFS